MCGRLGDVDQFLNEMASEEMDQIIAYDGAHGVGLDRLMIILVNGFTALINSWRSEKDGAIDPSDIDPWRKE